MTFAADYAHGSGHGSGEKRSVDRGEPTARRTERLASLVLERRNTDVYFPLRPVPQSAQAQHACGPSDAVILVAPDGSGRCASQDAFWRDIASDVGAISCRACQDRHVNLPRLCEFGPALALPGSAKLLTTPPCSVSPPAARR